MNEVVITEKSSQAGDVRRAVGDRYGAVLPAEGHLLDLCEPEDVNPAWKEWTTALLKPAGRYATKPAEGGNKAPKLKAILAALETADRVWLATDCDREGQLIGQEILEYAGYEGRVQRVLFTAQDPQTIREAFEKAKPNEHYANLYASAVARREADQIYNLSLTRTATVTLGRAAGGGVIGIGRVKTPTLAIVCGREQEIRDFKPAAYWEVVAKAAVAAGVLVLRHAPKEKIAERERAEEIAAAAEGFVGPLSVKVEEKRQRPPRLHDLPSLQKACGARWGWSAKKTLEVAQELYAGEGKKILSYPRAEVRYLPESAIGDVSRIVEALCGVPAYREIPFPDEAVVRTGKRGTFSDKQLEGASHHAIVPNANTVADLDAIAPRLSDDEREMFDLIARSYLAAVMPDFEYQQTTLSVDVTGHAFRAAGRQTKAAGWKDALAGEPPPGDEADAEVDQALPAMTDGENVALSEAETERKETRPPKRFGEGALVDEMKNAWRYVEDENQRARLKEAKGIGTPATRAEVIAGLRRQGFLTAKGNNVVPTERGIALYQVLQKAEPDLVNAGLTAEMELLLDEVVGGGRDLGGAVDAVCAMAERMIGKIASGAATVDGAALQQDRPPTAAMKRFAKSLAKSKNLKLPRGYASSSKVCRAFLDKHAAPRQEGVGASGPRPPSAAQLSYAEDIARGQGIEVPDEAKADARAISRWIDEHGKKRKGAGGQRRRR